MENPFKVGDRVYVPTAAVRLPVKGVFGQEVAVIEVSGETCVYDYRSVSFKPWPAPDHVRTHDHGYWLVAFKDFRRVYLAHYDSTSESGPWSLLSNDGSLLRDHTYADTQRQGNVRPITYLGTHLQNFPQI